MTENPLKVLRAVRDASDPTAREEAIRRALTVPAPAIDSDGLFSPWRGFVDACDEWIEAADDAPSDLESHTQTVREEADKLINLLESSQ